MRGRWKCHNIFCLKLVYFISFLSFLGTGSSSVPTVWPLRCKQTWSWKAFPPWRTKACSSVAPSDATLSPAHQLSMEPSELSARRVFLATGRTTGLPVGAPAPSLNPGWWNPAWRAPTQAEYPPSGGMAAGSCNFFAMKQRGLRNGAKRWKEKQRNMTCQRRVSVPKAAGVFALWCQWFTRVSQQWSHRKYS